MTEFAEHTLDAVIQKQKIFFSKGHTRDVEKRIQKLVQLEHVIKQNEDRLCEAVYKDFKKSAFDTQLTEFSVIYKEIKLAIRHLKKWAKPKKVNTNLLNWPATSFIDSEPYGVVLIIGAWNYPFQLTLVPLVSALAAGNTVVLKPSELSENSSLILCQILNEQFSQDFIYCAHGGISLTQKLLSFKFDKIFFTGSPRVGQIVYEAAARHLTPVTLELGGKSPCLVMSDADLVVAARRIVWGKFINAGQTCIAPDYLLVDKKIAESFLIEVKKQIKLFYGADSLLTQDYSRIINERNWLRLVRFLKESNIYMGGSYDQASFYIEPTVLYPVSISDSVMKEEIFGPILPVLTFENVEEIEKVLSSFDKPLAFYCFTENITQAYEVASRISFGGGVINDTLMHIANHNLPFGGVGLSGIGNYHGEYGFKAFTYQKSLLVKKTWFDPILRYPPYSKFTEKILLWLAQF